MDIESRTFATDVELNEWAIPPTGVIGTAIDATVMVTNKASVAITIQATVGGQHRTTGYGITSGLVSALIPPGMFQVITVPVVVPSDADVGSYLIGAAIYDADGITIAISPTTNYTTIRDIIDQSKIVDVCGFAATVDCSGISPGVGATWKAGHPTIEWGDPMGTITVSADVLDSYTFSYPKAGIYTIVLSGENQHVAPCAGYCEHVVHVLATKNPDGITATPAETSAKVAWTNIAGVDKYTVKMKKTGDVNWISETVVNGPSVDLVSLAPLTSYDVEVVSLSLVPGTEDVYIALEVPAGKLVTWCGNNTVTFTTSTCPVPICDFTVSATP